MLLDLNRFSFSVFLKEIRLLTALALPMLLAQVAQVGIGFVDTVMAGVRVRRTWRRWLWAAARLPRFILPLWALWRAEPDDCPALRRG